MVSFCQLLHHMESNLHENENTPAMQVIRTGLNIREDFWDDFISIANNPEGLADLLQVSPERITAWGGLIQENLDKVKEADQRGDGEEEPRTKVLDNDEDLGGISVNPGV